MSHSPTSQTNSLIAPNPSEVLSVTQLTRDIKQRIEPAFNGIWVRGEISNLRRQSSGHTYFTVKDEGSQISAALFRRDAERLDFNLREGLQVLVCGRVTVYEPRGQYQLVATIVLEDGHGKLQRRFEELKSKLAAEGLFATERKRPIPPFPKQIVVITSPTGAAIKDFISIIQRNNWPGCIRILPVRVQGQEAAPEIVDALRLANEKALGDLIVVCRGGGSLEDLWPFNEEIVARAVAGSQIPVISGVGHEIDFTLSDFAADRRAETPSAAAELIITGFNALQERFHQAFRLLNRLTDYSLQRQRQSLMLQKSRLQSRSPQHQLEMAWMRLDELSSLLVQQLSKVTLNASRQMDKLQLRLARQDPQPKLDMAAVRLKHLQQRLRNAGPEAAIKRGYVMLRSEDGQVISDLGNWPDQQTLEAQFRDGRVKVKKAGSSVDGGR